MEDVSMQKLIYIIRETHMRPCVSEIPHMRRFEYGTNEDRDDKRWVLQDPSKI